MEKDIVVSTLRMTKNQHSELQKIAMEKHYSLNTVMKMAIDYFLKLEERGR